jgi:hypothetical protein
MYYEKAFSCGSLNCAKYYGYWEYFPGVNLRVSSVGILVGKVFIFGKYPAGGNKMIS